MDIPSLEQEKNFYFDSKVGKNLIKLSDRPELGIFYNPSANIINKNQKYAIITANRLAPWKTAAYASFVPITCMMWMQIGYGCLVITPFVDVEPVIQKGNDLIQETLSQYNYIRNDKGLKEYVKLGTVVSMALKVDIWWQEIQVSQVSRLLASKLLKYSTSKEQFEKLQDTYFITSDVDLFPLSTRIYSEQAYDINLINVYKVDPKKNDLYVALSCIGATLSVWEALVSEQDYDIQYLNGTGMIELAESEKALMLEKNPKLSKTSWYMDQTLGSRWVANYGRRYGWDRINHWKENYVTGRMDRNSMSEGKWHDAVDENRKHLYKDAHVCRKIWDNDCWWKIYHLLKFHMDDKMLKEVEVYRNEFVRLMREMRKTKMFFGDGKEGKAALDEEDVEKEWFEKTGIDVGKSCSRDVICSGFLKYHRK